MPFVSSFVCWETQPLRRPYRLGWNHKTAIVLLLIAIIIIKFTVIQVAWYYVSSLLLFFIELLVCHPLSRQMNQRDDTTKTKVSELERKYSTTVSLRY